MCEISLRDEKKNSEISKMRDILHAYLCLFAKLGGMSTNDITGKIHFATPKNHYPELGLYLNEPHCTFTQLTNYGKGFVAERCK